MSGPSPELLTEWDEAHRATRDRLMGYLGDLGASSATCEYVGGLRLYLRAPFLLTVWVPDRERRRDLTYHLAAHVIGMKLFDDLLDADTELDRYELGGCLPLWHSATEALCRGAGDPQAVLRLIRDDFEIVSTGQLRTKRHPAASLAEWRAHADTYGGGFLGCYGSLAALAGGVPGAYEAATRLGYAFGMIVTIADDLRDYERKSERTGNLAHLVRTGATRLDEVCELIEELREIGVRAAGHLPVAYDVAPVVGLYADDVLNRMLPVVTR